MWYTVNVTPTFRSTTNSYICRYDTATACLLALASTLLGFLNVPVFWPILLIYFVALLIVSLKQRVQHMIKHRYIPLVNKGKPKFSQ
jgi:fatty acid desaturase